MRVNEHPFSSYTFLHGLCRFFLTRVEHSIAAVFLISIFSNAHFQKAFADDVDPCAGFSLDACFAACAVSDPTGQLRCGVGCDQMRRTCDFPTDYRLKGFNNTSLWRPSTGTWYVRDGRFYLLYRPAVNLQWGLSKDWSFETDQLINEPPAIHVIVWRPSNGTWYVCYNANTSVPDGCATSNYATQFGLSGDYPLLFDFDLDAKVDLAVWRPFLKQGKLKIEGQWYIRKSSDDTLFTVQWGLRGDYPLEADIDGDGKPDLAVWRPSTGTWYVLLSSTNYDRQRPFIRQWGLPGDHPMFFPVSDLVEGDLPGQPAGFPNALAVWRPESGNWYICPLDLTQNACTAPIVVQFGLPGDIPIPGALFAGHNTNRLVGVYRPSSGEWYYGTFDSVVDQEQHLSYSVTETVVTQWGLPGDVPTQTDIKTRIDLQLNQR